jgi:putative hydrolase of the HAD superfamily
MSRTIKVILFDLGGVLVELGENPVPPDWLPNDTKFNLSEWFSSETARSFEKGLVSPRQFAEALKRDLKIEASPESIILHFTHWPRGVFAGVHELLGRIYNNHRLAVLSNTNSLHWPRITGVFNISNYFEYMFSSHLLHMAKPEPEIFEYVISKLNVDPGKILFLDDNPKNVSVSNKLGMRGFHTMGIQQVQKVLSEVGIIDA